MLKQKIFGKIIVEWYKKKPKKQIWMKLKMEGAKIIGVGLH